MRDENLEYLSDVAKRMDNDLHSECQHIETKLHNFAYIWLAIVIAMITLCGKTINIFEQYVSVESYLLFFGISFIGIFRITYLFFKVYHYDGRYLVNHDIKTYRTYDAKNEPLENLIRTDLDAQQKCIENNSNLNNERNKNFNICKREFKYYLLLLSTLSIIIFMLN